MVRPSTEEVKGNAQLDLEQILAVQNRPIYGQQIEGHDTIEEEKHSANINIGVAVDKSMKE